LIVQHLAEGLAQTGNFEPLPRNLITVLDFAKLVACGAAIR
jgi:hypothetical protein